MQKDSEKQSLSRYRDSSLYTREPMVRSCIFMGMGFARSPRLLQRCNTKAKLAINRTINKNLTR